MSEYINHIKRTVDGNTTEIELQDFRIKDFPEGSEGKGLVITENNKVIPKSLDYLALSGGKLSGNLDMSNFKITNLFPGVNDTDAVTYRQLQNAIEGLGDVFVLKGVIQTLDELPTQNVAIGNIYYVNEAMTAYVWLEGNFNSTIKAGETQIQIVPSEIATKLRLISIKAVDFATSELLDISYQVNDNNIIVTLNEKNENDVIISGIAFWWSKFGSSVDLTPFIKYEEIQPIVSQYVQTEIQPVKEVAENTIQKPESAQENELLTYINGKWDAAPAPDTGVIEIDSDKSLDIDSTNKSIPKLKINISKEDKNSIELKDDGLYSVGVQSDFEMNDFTDPSFIKNKPEILNGEITSENKNALVNDTQVKNYDNKTRVQISNTNENFSEFSNVWINTSNNIGAEHESVSSINGKTGNVIIKSEDIYDSDNKTIRDKFNELDLIDESTNNEISNIKSNIENINNKINNSDKIINDQIDNLDNSISDNKNKIEIINSNLDEISLTLDEKEDKINKATTVFGNETNNTKYPSTKAVADLLNNTVYTDAENNTLYVSFVPTEFYGLKAEINKLQYGTEPTLSYQKGILTLGLPELRDGIGIVSIDIEETDQSGAYNNIIINLNDGSNYSFKIKNGIDGVNGKDGGTPIVSIEDTVNTTNGRQGITINVENADGQTNNGTVWNGLSAYEIALNNGFIGTEKEWLESIIGASVEFIYDTEERLTIINTDPSNDSTNPNNFIYIPVDDTFIPTITQEDLNEILKINKAPLIISPTFIFHPQSNSKWVATDVTPDYINYHIIQITNGVWNYSYNTVEYIISDNLS